MNNFSFFPKNLKNSHLPKNLYLINSTTPLFNLHAAIDSSLSLYALSLSPLNSSPSSALSILASDTLHRPLIPPPQNTLSSFLSTIPSIINSLSYPYPIHLYGSPFQITVWQALTSLPKSSTTSYKSLASLIGKPSASRAVGSAISSNPIALLIPCHLVIHSSGNTGHYRWSPSLKTILLKSHTQYRNNTNT